VKSFMVKFFSATIRGPSEAEQLKELEAVVPGQAKQLCDERSSSHAHRIRMGERQMSINEISVKDNFRLAILGVIGLVFLGCAAMYVVYFTAKSGHPKEAAEMFKYIGGILAAFIGVRFILSRLQRDPNLTRKIQSRDK